jgi:hypothetical protein
MKHTQADLFAQDNAERNRLPESTITLIRHRLQTILASLETAEVFPWADPLEAVHLENRFERDAERLGEEGTVLWARFDKEMDRLHTTRK